MLTREKSASQEGYKAKDGATYNRKVKSVVEPMGLERRGP